MLTVLLTVYGHKLYFQPNKFFIRLESCQLNISQAQSTCHKVPGLRPNGKGAALL